MATLIDLLIAAVPALLVSRYLDEGLQTALYKIVFLYFFHTTLVLFISRRYTVGEKWMRIALAALNADKISFSLLFLRNLTFSFFVFLIVLSWGSIFEIILTALLFLSMNLIYKNDKYRKPMTMVDFVFKTYYAHI